MGMFQKLSRFHEMNDSENVDSRDERYNRDRRMDGLGCQWMSWDRKLEDVLVCLKISRKCQFYLRISEEI